MKIEIDGRFAIIKEITKREIYQLIDILTFKPTSTSSYNASSTDVTVDYKFDNIPYVDYGDLHIKEKVDPKKKPAAPKEKFCSLLFLNTNNEYYFFSNLLLFLGQNTELEIDVINKEALNLPKKSNLKIEKDILDNITLRDYQVATINKILWYKSGVFQGATGFGKTAVIIALSKFYLDNNLVKRILIVTPNLAITDNMMSRFKLHNLEHIVSGAGGDFTISDTPIVVGNINTVYRAMKTQSGEVFDIIKDTDMMIYDECHHASSYTSFRTAMMINPEYLYGFSGTPYRVSGQSLGCYEDGLVQSLFGLTMASVSTRYLIQKGFLAQPYIFMKNVGPKGIFYPSQYNKIYDKFILNNVKRNEFIVSYAKLFVKNDLKTLILVQRIDHIDMLLNMLKDYKVIGVSGSNTGKIIDPVSGIIEEFTCSYEQAWDDIENGKYDIGIASVVADEGVDIPSLDAIIMGGGGKSVIKIYQRTGRGLRPKINSVNAVLVLDFWDTGHPYVSSHSKKRSEHYDDMGSIKVNEVQFIQMINQINKG